MSSPRLLLSTLGVLALASFAAARDEPTLDERLEKLAVSLETARKEAHIPGMSIAIVKDGEVVWARGFGLANIAEETPADADTIYAIGSTTKAFTATLVGSLVDEGAASWDDPVTKHLPYFDLAVRSDEEDAACTLRDLLSHRHGFARMSMLWIGGKTSREEILRAAVGAEPFDDFREGFHYCNVTYLAAGMAAGAAAGSTWDALMTERIFDPLGMTSTTLSRPAAQKDPRLALGYEWDAVDERFNHLPMFNLEPIGPAGSVNSNVVDMAQWLRLQLGGGEVDGKRVISNERLLETWSPQIEIGGGADYGLGWMLREHDGRKVVEHGGAIDGFTAEVALIPEENLGYVLLMNVDSSPLREPSMPMVFDALLDEWPEDAPDGDTPAAASDVDFDDYVGTYIASFGNFRDAEFEVKVQDDQLALAIPGQGTMGLELPDAEGRWTSVRSAEIAISFQTGADGSVVGLTVHQGPFTFEVPRKGVELQPEVPASELERYVGDFVRAQGGKQVKILIDHGRLAMVDGGELLVFHTPDAEGHAALRFRAEWGATFKADAEGNVASFVFRGSSGDKLFRRVADATEAAIPTLEEVLALRGTDARIAAVKADGGTKVSGEAWIAQAGLRGKLTIYTQGSDRVANHMDFGKFGRVSSVLRAGEAWTYNPLRGVKRLKGDQLTQAILGQPGAVDGDWTEYFDTVEVFRNDTLNDRATHVVRLEKKGLPSRTYWVDAEHGDVLQVKQIVLERTMRIPVTITYSEFAEVDGIRTAMHVVIENPMTGRTVLSLDKIESGLELDDALFSLSDPVPGEGSKE